MKFIKIHRIDQKLIKIDQNMKKYQKSTAEFFQIDKIDQNLGNYQKSIKELSQIEKIDQNPQH